MLNRSQACAALIVFSSLSFAQEASTPPADSGTPASGASSLIVPSSSTQIPELTPAQAAAESAAQAAQAAQKPAADANEEQEGFSLPGGMGYAPLNFTPGQGSFDRQPLTFSTTLQQGYDDNIYDISNNNSVTPKKGSMVTNLSEGADLLLAQSRFALSMNGNLGGQYYWDRTGDQLTPVGGLNVVFGYKLSKRIQLSGIVNAAYTTQPTVSVINGAVQSNGKGYALVNSKFDLLYRLSPLVSTDTTYAISGIYYKDSVNAGGDSTTQTVGQSVRYAFSRLLTGVVEGRASQVQYNSTTNDANLYYLLTGADLTVSRRFTASARVGCTLQDQSKSNQSGSSNNAMPYAESSLNYALTKTSQLSANLRYGYNDNGSTGAQSTKNIRAGVAYTCALTPHLRGILNLNLNHNDGANTTPSQDTISGSAGAQYDLSKNLTLFANYNQVRQITSAAAQEYTKNIYYLGATYNY
ncbi:MAG: outer membrane beta-barrel protein [Verrucomicrobiota bacterium]